MEEYKKLSIMEEIQERFPDDEDLLCAPPEYDSAVVGIDIYKMVLIYSVVKITEILVERDGMLPDEAMEFFDFNIAGAYMGAHTPIWLDDFQE